MFSLVGIILPRHPYKGHCLMMSNLAETQAVWRDVDCVCFDVDSTVCLDETIDELASFLEVGDQVADLTKRAMQGSMTYKQSLAARLKLMQPSQQKISKFIAENPPKLTPGIKELVAALHQRDVEVYLVSGGFRSVLEVVAKELKIPICNIYANRLMFYHNGEFAGFCEDQPTCESGGKPKVIQLLKDRHGYKKVVMVGDGATDMEAYPPADAFIGFGGNQIREKVKAGAAWFVMDFQEMINKLS